VTAVGLRHRETAQRLSAIILIGSLDKSNLSSAENFSFLQVAASASFERKSSVEPLSPWFLLPTHHPFCFHLIEYSNLDWGHSYRLDSSRLRQVSKTEF
jgi:hypothetical protein